MRRRSGADAHAELVEGKHVAKGDWLDHDELHDARVDRALIEIAKRGEDARSQLARLLVELPTRERWQRSLLLHALVRIAPRPCEACEQALDEVLAADECNTALAALRYDTQLVRLYFGAADR